jgi:uncharacterized repeat protein (TIGR01451 family)
MRPRLLVLLALFLGLAFPAITPGAILTVDTTLDDATKSACDDAVDGDCSLRGAIAKANADAGPETVMVPAGTYTFANASPCTFLPHAGDSVYGSPVIPVCINSDVDIIGAGAGETIIQSDGADRVFAISKLTTVTMRDCTLNGGRAFPGFGYAIGGGGAINAQGTLTLTDMVVQNHQAQAGGGAILNRGTLTIVRSTFSATSTPQGGGAIAHYGGLLTIIDSSFSGGTAHNGGAIAAGSEVVISGSTFEGNAATVGGVLFLQGGPATILSSTVSNNQGIAIDVGRSSPEYASTLHVVSSTITKNSGHEGGGMYVTGNQYVYVRNSIFADNTAAFAPDAGGKFTSEGYNLFGSTQNAIILGDTSTNVTGVAARLAPLSDNGGPTRTHAPLPAQDGQPASPAIDAGNPATPGSEGFACPGTDQRGVLRPVGVRCDIGAVERAAGLSLARIAPTRAGAAGPLAAVLVGNGFHAGATVKLARAGQADVTGAPVTVGASGSTLAASFDLAGRPLGAWDVVVTNPDGSSATLPAALTLEETREPKLWADIVGKSAVRVGSPVRYTVIYGNRGNVDAVGVPLSIVTPKNFVFDPIFPLTTPPAATGLTLDEFGRVRIDVTMAEETDARSVPLLLPIVPAGFTGTMDFIVTLPAGTPHGSDFGLEIKIEPQPWLATQATLDAAVTDLVARGRAYAERGFGTSIPSSVDEAARAYARAQLEAIATTGRNELVARLGQAGSVYSVAQITIDVAAYMQAQALAASTVRVIADTFLAVLGHTVVAPACAEGNPCRCICNAPIPEGCSCSVANCEKPYQPDDKPPKPGDPFTPADCRELPNHKVSEDGKTCIPINTKNCAKIQQIFYTDPDCIRRPIVNSVDPNDKYASAGSGETHVVTGDEPLKYAIAFENLPAASAPAQTVVVTDQLDTASLDLSTFAFGPIAVGAEVTIVPPPGLSTFVGGAELPEQNVVVTVVARLDHDTGIVTWTFGSLDPATRQPTDDALAGFLPPNTSPPAGEGRVFFTVGVKPSVATGTVITNQASIVFDLNEAIETPQVSNVVDKTAPTSAVTQITPAAACGDTALTVVWGGTDDGSSIRDWDVLVSEDGGPATLWKAATTETSATFAGVAGKQYAFHTTARDAVDNSEDAPATADVTYTVVPCGGGTTTTTSTTIAGSTTTTTLPGCEAGASFDGVACRVAGLRTRLGQLGLGKIGKQLDKTLRKAATAIAQAQSASGKKRVKAVRRATKAMNAFGKKLASKAAVKTMDAATRAELSAPVGGILADLAGLATPA